MESLTVIDDQNLKKNSNKEDQQNNKCSGVKLSERGKAQRVQKEIPDTAKESREFEMIIRKIRVVMSQITHKNTKINLYKDADTAVQQKSLADIWHLEEIVKDVVIPTT